MTACIVDDDQIYVYSFKKILSLKKICSELIDFENGMDAVDFLTNPENADSLPDVIFLDINMPIMDGWGFMEAFGEIKSRLGKEITVYMVSSSINPQDVYRAKNIPEVSDYFVKPVNPATLAHLLDPMQQAS